MPAMAASVSAYAVSSTRRDGRMQLHHLPQQLGARHVGHALIDEEERDLSVARCERLRRLEAFSGRGRLHDAVVGSVLLSEVALDRAEDGGIVVDHEDDGFGQGRVLLTRGW